MKKIFNIKVATILVAIVAVLGAFGLLKDESTSWDDVENEKFYCTLKKEDILHDVKPKAINYSVFDDNTFYDMLYMETKRYGDLSLKLSESRSKLAHLKVQINAERGPIDNKKPITKEQQDALDKAQKEVDTNYQTLKNVYISYKPVALSLLNEVQRRQEIERKKGIKPEESKFYIYSKYSDYHLDDTDCINREDENN